MSKDINKEGLLKGLGALLLGIIVLSLVYNMFFQMGPTTMGGMGGGMESMHGGMSQGMYTGFSLSGLLAGLLLIFIKLLSILLVVGLVMGIFLMFKKLMLDNGDFNNIFAGLGFQGVDCCNCGKKVRGNWDYCPHCGEALKKSGNKQ